MNLDKLRAPRYLSEMKNKPNYTQQNRMLAIFKALANTNRLKILKLIYAAQDGKISVSELVENMDINQSTISDHLKLMRIQKIVRAQQQGYNMFYSINEPLVAELISRMD